MFHVSCNMFLHAGLVDGAFLQSYAECWCWGNAQAAGTGEGEEQH